MPSQRRLFFDNAFITTTATRALFIVIEAIDSAGMTKDIPLVVYKNE